MNTTLLALGLMLVAFLVTMLVYPYVLSFAISHKILDNPNARKLQRVPVPVMGGASVYAGVLVASIVAIALLGDIRVLWCLLLLTLMFGMGVWDDMKDVSVYLRFFVEIGVVWVMILVLGLEINDFHGLWGVHEIPDTVSMPLSLIAGVGIMNAINLIDGVDGYCSSYGVMCCAAFAIVFYLAGGVSLLCVALIFIGALLPFFLHNVFGQRSKMFLGDGGSLMLGTVLSFFVFATMSSERGCNYLEERGLSLAALSLAIMAVPVFDTVRVMTARILKGKSPFHPDKTHLHHIFIEMDFSHLSTSFIIILGNLIIILSVLLAWWLGASMDVQLYIVIGLSLLFTCGFYYFMAGQQRLNDGEGSAIYKKMCALGRLSHRSNKPFWRFMRRVVDSRFLGGKTGLPVPGEPIPQKPKLDPRIR